MISNLYRLGLSWADPINIIGSMLGIAAILVIVLALKDVTMPLIPDFRTAFLVLAALLLCKVGLKILQDWKEKNPNRAK